MERGYIKLYRAIDQNELLENDNTALVVFIKLLTRVDRRTGTYRTGRFKLAHLCNLRPSTLRDALKRLEVAKVIRQQSDSRATTIYICNWAKYQQNDDSSPSTQRRFDDTKQEKKEKETIDTNVSIVKAKTPSVEINELLEYWETTVGFAITGQKQKNRYACSNLIKSHGLEKAMRLVDGVAQAGADRYAPRIADFVQLQHKQNELIAWGKKTIIGSKPKGVVIR